METNYQYAYFIILHKIQSANFSITYYQYKGNDTIPFNDPSAKSFDSKPNHVITLLGSSPQLKSRLQIQTVQGAPKQIDLSVNKF